MGREERREEESTRAEERRGENERRGEERMTGEEIEGDVVGGHVTYGQGVDVDDHEVEGHGQGHGGQQPEVAPWGHTQQRLVLRQAGRHTDKQRNRERDTG